jgi:hypothetical protein
MFQSNDGDGKSLLEQYTTWDSVSSFSSTSWSCLVVQGLPLLLLLPARRLTTWFMVAVPW